MSPKKLSDEEKTELIRLYRQTDATTATLAEHFQVSSSTVSRVLRNNLSSEEYENLIQRKRHNRQKKQSSSLNLTTETTGSESEEKTTPSQSEKSGVSSSQPEPKPATSSEVDSESSLSDQPLEVSLSSQEISISPEQDEQEFVDQIDFSVIQAMFGEDVGEDDDLEDSEEEDWEEEEETVQTERKREDEVEVLPLSQAKFPRTCYLVIDRGANLITKPLKEFSDLGKIPSVETQQKTLPIFENHRVARRFSNRSQKVIKIPDGKMIKKTREHLEAKGIKRILMDGKVYTLS